MATCCVPAPGDHIQVEIDEVRRRARADQLKSPQKSNPQHKPTMTKELSAATHDMFTYGSIHFDMS